MLLLLLCGDVVGVVLPYLLKKEDIDTIVALDNVETLRAEFAAVVEERRRRAGVVYVNLEHVQAKADAFKDKALQGVCNLPSCDLTSATSDVKLKLCSGCKKVHYCSVAHQHADWPMHKLVCAKRKPLKKAMGPGIIPLLPLDVGMGPGIIPLLPLDVESSSSSPSVNSSKYEQMKEKKARREKASSSSSSSSSSSPSLLSTTDEANKATKAAAEAADFEFERFRLEEIEEKKTAAEKKRRKRRKKRRQRRRR
jgi:hypothetical protein